MRNIIKTSPLMALGLALSLSSSVIADEDTSTALANAPEHNDVVMRPAADVTKSNWCQNRQQFEYGVIGDGFVGFQLKKGTLTGNIERFIAEFHPDSNGFISKVGRHVVPGDYCLVANSTDELLQAIIEPYFVGSVPIYYGKFKNNFHALFYKDDPEFVRYRLGVRK